jgi:hypothetical protein
MHGRDEDEVTCEHCAHACEFSYGDNWQRQLAGYMERHHGRCKPTILGFGPSTTVVAHRCARCSMMFTGESNGHINAQIAAHADRCFVVGDYVRWEMGERWHEGPIIELREHDAYMECVRGAASSYPFRISFNRANMRRIERPVTLSVSGTISHTLADPTAVGQKRIVCTQAWGAPTPSGTTEGTGGRVTINLFDGLMRGTKAEPAPTCECFAAHLCEEHALEVEYDGVTLRSLLDADEYIRREGRLRMNLTPAQRAAVSAHWSAQLRLKQQKARERERLQVVVEQDAGDFEW